MINEFQLWDENEDTPATQCHVTAALIPVPQINSLSKISSNLEPNRIRTFLNMHV
jgi:hypothetical protein